MVYASMKALPKRKGNPIPAIAPPPYQPLASMKALPKRKGNLVYGFANEITFKPQ